MAMKVIARGLRFPEGPVVASDGTAYVVELRRGFVTRISPGGATEVIANPGGGPNGLAFGPDGCLFICNNGGFLWSENGAPPDTDQPSYTGGRIEKLDLRTGKVEVLYDRCGEKSLTAPNDLVFDKSGGFYFTDMGKTHPTYRMHGAIYYSAADGSSIVEVASPLVTPNGIGLSPDENVLYFAETNTARLWAFDIVSPGVVAKDIKFSHAKPPHGGRFIAGVPSFQRFDSLAIEADGNICVAALVAGAINVFSPGGELLETISTGDVATTNICFGGPDMRTAFITYSSSGELVSMPWPRPGHRLNFSF